MELRIILPFCVVDRLTPEDFFFRLDCFSLDFDLVSHIVVPDALPKNSSSVCLFPLPGSLAPLPSLAPCCLVRATTGYASRKLGPALLLFLVGAELAGISHPRLRGAVGAVAGGCDLLRLSSAAATSCLAKVPLGGATMGPSFARGCADEASSDPPLVVAAVASGTVDTAGAGGGTAPSMGKSAWST